MCSASATSASMLARVSSCASRALMPAVSISINRCSGRRLSSLRQFGRIAGGIALHAEQAAEHAQLLVRAEALVVHGDERDVTRAWRITQRAASLADSGGLANAGRTDESHAAAVVEQAVAGHGEMTGQMRQRATLRVFGRQVREAIRACSAVASVLDTAISVSSFSSSAITGARRVRSFQASCDSCHSSQMRAWCAIPRQSAPPAPQGAAGCADALGRWRCQCRLRQQCGEIAATGSGEHRFDNRGFVVDTASASMATVTSHSLCNLARGKDDGVGALIFAHQAQA